MEIKIAFSYESKIILSGKILQCRAIKKKPGSSSYYSKSTV